MPTKPPLEPRLRAAFSALDLEARQRVEDFMRREYHASCAHVETALGRTSEPIPEEGYGTEGVALAYATLFEDPRQLRTQVEILAGHRGLGDVPSVTADGQIVSVSKYDLLDPGWAESVAVWLESLFHRAPFPTGENVAAIPDEVTLAIVGDWGTGAIPGSGPTPALAMMQFVRNELRPGVTVHLGDVYYAGTGEEEHDNFLATWVAGTHGTFALDSNHEMMAGGHGYFDTLLAHPDFAAQHGLAYFALENASWIVVGLDTAYFADRWSMYSPGALDEEHQLPFLGTQAERAASTDKKVIVLTHHNGFAYDGSAKRETLWDQVTKAFPDGSAPTLWYWGHVHVGAVYPPTDGVEVRCCGHGGIPWGLAEGLVAAQGRGDVTWFERQPIAARPPQVANGLAALRLAGPEVTETFYRYDGSVSWTS